MVSKLTQIFFLTVALFLGAVIGQGMPRVPLHGLSLIFQTEILSGYFGGVGISFMVGGFGLLLNKVGQILLAKFQLFSVSKGPKSEWLAPAFYCFTGVLLVAWYSWSYFLVG